MLSLWTVCLWFIKFCETSFLSLVFYHSLLFHFHLGFFLFNIHEMNFRWKVCESHLLVQPIKLCRRKLPGRLTLIVYSLAVNLQVHGVLEVLLSLILKAKSRIKLTFACIESRMAFVMALFLFLFIPLFSFCRKFQSVRNLNRIFILLLGLSTESCLSYPLSCRLEQFNDVLCQENNSSYNMTSPPLFDLPTLMSITSKEPNSLEALVCLLCHFVFHWNKHVYLVIIIIWKLLKFCAGEGLVSKCCLLGKGAGHSNTDYDVSLSETSFLAPFK